MDTARALRVILARKGKSQYWLAKQTNLTKEYICNLCSDNNDKKPSIDAAERICDALGVKMSEFFKEGEDDV